MVLQRGIQAIYLQSPVMIQAAASLGILLLSQLKEMGWDRVPRLTAGVYTRSLPLSYLLGGKMLLYHGSRKSQLRAGFLQVCQWQCLTC